MFFRKTGLPEEGDVLLCTVTKIQYHSVFVNIDEYHTSGMIHISEIAAGRIRNIRDYVKEGKKVVCKVLRVHHDKGHVDLSLRRVTDAQRRNKVNEVKLEQKAESIIKYIARQRDMPAKKLYEELAVPLLKEYEYLHHAFEDIVAGALQVAAVSKDKKIQKDLEELVLQRFKPKFVEISGVLQLSTYDSNGIEIVKDSLKEAEKNEAVTLSYLGGGKYKVTVKSKEYKDAEPILKKAVDGAITYVTKHDGKGEFIRK